MDVFACPACRARIFSEDLACMCGARVALDPLARRFDELPSAEPCTNRETIGCNWQAGPEGLCRACATTETVPDPNIGENVLLWSRAESAKRRVMLNLMRWGLFTDADRRAPPVFDLLAEQTADGAARVVMGHADGHITINVAEADPATREARRADMDEPYRTMTGHFRHELGHFVFLRLIGQPDFAAAFGALFGDHGADYGAALERHYAEGPPEGWRESYLTAYAAAHPHEDWAESFAHFLHLVDMVDSARAVGLAAPMLERAGEGFDAYAAAGPEPLLTIAADVGIAVNHVNRSMGLPDLYPFVLTPVTREKLALVQRWLPRAA